MGLLWSNGPSPVGNHRRGFDHRNEGRWNAGIIPEWTDEPEEAYRLLERDGAAILSWDRTGSEGATAATKAVLGRRLRAQRAQDESEPCPSQGQRTRFDWTTRNVQQRIHFDGHTMYGEAYPDFDFRLCSMQAPFGGDSFIVDGQRIIDAIAGDPLMREFLQFLWQFPIEQSTPGGIPIRGTILRRTSTGRLAIRRHGNQRLSVDSPEGPEPRRFLSWWFAITNAAAAAAPRFRLQPGDVLCLDNYRTFHGRERYFGGHRLLYRIGAWSDMAFAVPDVNAVDRGPAAAEKKTAGQHESHEDHIFQSRRRPPPAAVTNPVLDGPVDGQSIL